MPEPLTGSCLCGGVHYTVTGALRPVIACHCTQCRKTSGHYVAATQVARSDLTIEGETLVWYRSSEIASRGFCSRCGGNLFWQRHGSDRTSIFAGTLDGPTGLFMESQLYADDKGDYYDLPTIPAIDQATLV